MDLWARWMAAHRPGLMLEMARLLCPKKQKLGVWIAFLDGEEAFVDWEKDNDNTYGSRQLAARMALADEIKHVKAVILADMIGPKNLRIMREPNSTGWLVDIVWSTRLSLGIRMFRADGRLRRFLTIICLSKSAKCADWWTLLIWRLSVLAYERRHD